MAKIWHSPGEWFFHSSKFEILLNRAVRIGIMAMAEASENADLE